MTRFDKKKGRVAAVFKEFKSLTSRQRLRIIAAMLIFIIPVAAYAVSGSVNMYNNKLETLAKYDDEITISEEELSQLVIPEGSVEVQVGSYMESITNVDVKNNTWACKFLVWFRWDGDEWTEPSQYPGENFIIGNGNMGGKTLMEEYHENGKHYQQYRVTATVEKYFDTTRYPLDSHQLKVFIEDERDMSIVRYTPDKEHSTISPYLTIAGFDIINYDSGLYLNEYSSKMNDPIFDNVNFETEGKKTFEYVFVTRVKRDGYGLFLKAFLNLFGILLWVCIGLYNCAYNRVDAMGAINTGIFGAVSSMIVGMNLLSDARGSGLIEYINLFSLAMILITTIYVIRINKYRAKGDELVYTDVYSKMLFWAVLLMSIITITSFVLCAAT